MLFDLEKGLIAYARTLMRLPNVEKWHKDSIAALKATPYDLHTSKEPTVTFKDQVERDEPAEDPVVQARRVYIRASDLDGFGYTDGCPKCQHILRYGSNVPTGKNHNEKCRQRIMKRLSETEEGRARLGEAANRMVRSVAEHVERHDDRLRDREPVQGERRLLPELPVPEDPFKFEPIDTVPVIHSSCSCRYAGRQNPR